MKRLFFAFIVMLTAFVPACKDEGSLPNTPVTAKPPYPSFEPGLVAVSFVEGITVSQADQFVRGLDLIPFDLSRVESNTFHLGIVRVPYGQEQLWVDSLKTYSMIVHGAGLIAVTHVAQVPPNQSSS